MPTVVFSLDDLYLTHADQKARAQTHPDNPLLQHRGQPGTHDIQLAHATFKSLKANEPTRIPQYNKAAFDGAGDRVPESEWEKVNSGYGLDRKVVKVIVFEGWCTGFRALDNQTLRHKWEEARYSARKNRDYRGRLGHTDWDSIVQVNEYLRAYDILTVAFDAFVHIDAAYTPWVYKWRLQQEQNLREEKGSGMSDEGVKRFIDGCELKQLKHLTRLVDIHTPDYPAYELYTDELRRGLYAPDVETHLRLVVNEDRRVVKVENVVRAPQN